MGTSSIFNGPVKPLLPDDYDDASDDGEDNDTPPDSEKHPVPYKWKDAKTSMTNYVKGSSSDRGRVMNRYVSAAGGSKRLSQSSVAGRSTAISIGRIIQDFRNNGVEATLQSLQIDCVGKGIKVALSQLVNVISGKSNFKEDIVARGAAKEAIAEMYRIITENDGDIESLRQIDDLTFRNILELFMSEYIFKRVMSALQSSFEKYESDSKEAVKKEQELKGYVKVKVELRMRDISPATLDYSSKSISVEIDNLFVKCYQAFEDYV
jgi:hypothetical protein